jgi:short-subunit dehydrogenase
MAFQPGPYMAVYAASKTFVLSFSESLWAECRTKGVRVVALCPGSVATGFWKARGGKDPRLGALLVPVERAERVAHIGLMALERGRPYVIPGFRTYLFAQASRFVPRSWAAGISELVTGPRRIGQNTTSPAAAE